MSVTEIVAYQKYVRTSPRKLRLVADSVRHLLPHKALIDLKFMRKRAALVLAGVLKQAVSNAVNNQNLAKESLRIKSLEIQEGPTLKRWRAVSRGRAHRILKRMSHIKIILTANKDNNSQSVKKQSKSIKAKKQKLAEVK